MSNLVQGIQFSADPDNFSVTYLSPNRKIDNLRDEFNRDAVTLSNHAGPMYVALSSGVDSQIIARCFLDMKIDAEFVFLHVDGYNEQEYQRILECEKFFNISVRKIKLDIDSLKDEWVNDNRRNKVNSLIQYPFLYLSSALAEDWPIVTQGKAEPCVVGGSRDRAAIYHNLYEDMELRFALMRRKRTVYDFPFSPEAISSYYTDANMKTFVSTLSYYHKNGLTAGEVPLSIPQYFNCYAKAFVKGKYFTDVKWYPKLTGFENYPPWMHTYNYNKPTRVSVPYWDMVDLLENTKNTTRIYTGWQFQE